MQRCKLLCAKFVCYWPSGIVGWLSIVLRHLWQFCLQEICRRYCWRAAQGSLCLALNRKGSCCDAKHCFFFLGLIRWTVPFKTSRRYGGPLLTRIPGLPGILTFWGRRFSNVNIAFSVIRSYLHSEIGMSPFIWTKLTSLFPWMFCADFCWICRGKWKITTKS